MRIETEKTRKEILDHFGSKELKVLKTTWSLTQKLLGKVNAKGID